MRTIFLSALTLGSMLAGGTLWAAEPVDYVRAVKPILTARCYACRSDSRTSRTSKPIFCADWPLQPLRCDTSRPAMLIPQTRPTC